MKNKKSLFDKKNIRKNSFENCIIILFWLCVWQVAAVLTHNNILLVGPWQVGEAFLENITRPDFLKIVVYSFGRIGLGFFLALLFGVFMGALSYRYPFLEALFSPLMTTLKSIPVASFVVLLLIWFGSARLSFFISFLIVFPNVYVNTIAGLKSTERQLLEMAEVFGIRGWNRFCYLYRPALMPYLISCLKISLGMSWKSGVAAEVIGMPEYSLGERLYMSKIYLDTAGLFAWTLTVILLSFLFEKAVLYLVKKFAAWKPYPFMKWQKGNKVVSTDGSLMDMPEQMCDRNIYIKKVSKTYGEQQVLKEFSLTMEAGKHYCLMAPSGSGKTTLLRLMNRIEQPDSGEIEGLSQQVGMVFQEDRLCNDYSVIKNIMLTIGEAEYVPGTGNKSEQEEKEPENQKQKKNRWRQRKDRYKQKEQIKESIRKEALRILPEDCLDKPVSELSGGMKRRCAILRAMLSGADMIMMDEPFAGLDEENRRKSADYILERLQGRTLLVTTHREEDVELLCGVRVELADKS